MTFKLASMIAANLGCDFGVRAGAIRLRYVDATLRRVYDAGTSKEFVSGEIKTFPSWHKAQTWELLDERLQNTVARRTYIWPLTFEELAYV